MEQREKAQRDKDPVDPLDAELSEELKKFQSGYGSFNMKEDLFEMKHHFKSVLEKYKWGDGVAAPQVAKWLVTDNDYQRTVQRVAQRWDMSFEEAGHFARWIQKGLEM